MRSRIKIENDIKNGLTLSNNSDTLDGYRYCRECGEWLWRRSVESHLKSHNLTFKSYCYKYNPSLEDENPRPCPYCNSGVIIGLFSSSNGGSVTTSCSKSCSKINFFTLEENRLKVSNRLRIEHLNPESGYNSPERRADISKQISIRNTEDWKNPNHYFNSIEHKKFMTNVGGKVIRNYNKDFQNKSEEMILYIGVCKLNTNVIKVGISSTNSGRLGEMSNLLYIINIWTLNNKIASDIEILILDQTKNYLYFEEDRKSLLGDSNGISELRYIEIYPLILKIIENEGIVE